MNYSSDVLAKIAKKAQANVAQGGGIFLRVAIEHKADYGDVLWYVDYIAKAPSQTPLHYWLQQAIRNLSGDCCLDAALTFDYEMERQHKVRENAKQESAAGTK